MGYSQKDSPLALTTAPWADTLLLTALEGAEAVSELFQFRLDFVQDLAKPAVAFHDILGKPLTARLRQSAGKSAAPEVRFFGGICSEFSEGRADETFRHYRATVVPSAWLMTRRARSRVFQPASVPQILMKVLAETITEPGGFVLELAGKYEPRDYCSQYRETDFDFVSRLMEEEGIFYFFRFADGKHQMVLADSPKSHAPLPRPAFLVTVMTDNHRAQFGSAFLRSWEKRQELRSGKVTLWDHTFELPHQNTEATKGTQESVKAGKADHKLKVAVNAPLELYDWPGGYAGRFDGVPPGGGERPDDIQKIISDGKHVAGVSDNKRTAGIRMGQEASGAVAVGAACEWGLATPGYKLIADTLPADTRAKVQAIEGEYIILRVTHQATAGGDYISGGSSATEYSNTLICQPAALPFVPARRTPRPAVRGSQSAVVVGPPGEEIFTDKYGRVKVQFHWDREGKRNADSSCWIRVSHAMAGRSWGAFHLPRIGQEVLVDFLEGDPDQPIISGCLYNPDQMPPYKLPDHKTRSYLRTNSSPGGKGHNELRFEDKAGAEQIYLHAQRNLDERVRNDCLRKVGHDQHERVGFYIPLSEDGTPQPEKKHGHLYEEVAVDHHYKVHKNLVEHVGGDCQLLIGGVDGPGTQEVHVKKDRLELIDGNADFTVKGKLTETVGAYDLGVGKDFREKVGGDYSVTVGKNEQHKAGMKIAAEAGQEIHLKAGMNVMIESGMTLTLKAGGNFISFSPAGITIVGTLVMINSGGAPGSGTGSAPQEPADAKAPKDAAPTKPKEADSTTTGKKSN